MRDAWGSSIMICAFIGIFTMSHIVLCHFFKPSSLAIKSLSESMLIYFLTHIFNLIISIVYHFYMVFWWRPDKNLYNPNLIFWFGTFDLNYLVCAPVVTFFLTLDRCLVLKMTFRYNYRIKAWVVRTTLFVLILSYLFSTLVYVLELPLDPKKVANCDIYACVVQKYRNLPQLFIKLFIGTLNIICSGVFFYLVRNSSSTIKNRTVKATVLSEILFNVIPAYFGYFFNQVTGVSLANYAGQFALFLGAVDVALCGTYYSFILIRNKSKKPLSVASTISNVIHVKSKL